MKGTNRILSWLLIVCMVLGMFPMLAPTAEAANVYTKVTSAPSDWSGTYLIVYENGDSSVAFNGALAEPDVVSNTVAVTISDNTITGSTEIDAATVTITAKDGGYSIKTSAGLYIGSTSDANDLPYNESDNYVNTLAIDADGNALIGSSTTYLRYNSASNQLRFRYYKSTSYAGQQPITLYKLGGSGSTGGGNGSGDSGSTVVANGDAYMLVTSASDLVAGESYVIAATESDFAMSTTQNANNRGQVAVTKDENVLYFETEVQEFVLGAGTTTGTYSFKLADGSGYIYAASASGNYLRTESVLSANSSWSISVTSAGVATVAAQGANTRNVLRYNSGSKIFSCYAAENSMKDIALYRKVYTLVTDASQLQIGDSIVIAAKDDNYAITKTQSSTNRSAGAVTKSPETTGYALTFASSANILEFVLREGVNAGTYSFFDPKINGYLYAASSSSNSLKTTTSMTVNASWTIAVTAEGVATVTAQGANTHNVLKYNYNGGSPIFSAYLPTSGMGDIAIYRKVANVNKYTATFYVGESIDQTIVTTGELTLPENATFTGWTFEGWVTSETDALINGTTTAPSYVSENVVISADTSYYAVFSLNGTYTTRPVEVEDADVEASMKIITGEGTVYFSTDGGKTQYGTAATEKGVEVRNNAEGLETLTLVIKPKDGYRIACIEKSSDRLFATTDYIYDATLGAYIYTFAVNSSSSKNYFRISFLPRISDGGFTATQITGWNATDASGLYVITGMESPEDYTNNAHDVTSTYLLYGDHDTAVDDSMQAVGRKSSALQLSSIGVALSNKAPFLMTGLSATHLMQFTRYIYNGKTYYLISMHGATDNTHTHYICARSGSSAYIYTSESYLDSSNNVNLYALWSVTYLDNGAVAIENAGHAASGASRYLMFNSTKSNLQFRCYPANSSTADYPVLYKATQSHYQVSYSINGSGSVKVTNTTTSTVVSAGSYQPAESTITFEINPATGYTLGSVTVNGVAVSITNNSYTYAGLDKNLNVVVTFIEIAAAKFTVQYYLNNTLNKTISVTNKTPYVIDSTVKLTYNNGSYPASQFSFDRTENGTAIYASIDAKIDVKQGDTIKVYFSNTDVDRTKNVTEITHDGANTAALGGVNTSQFTNANQQDPNSNVKQSFHVDLNVKSSDMISESVKGGNTDIILVLDHSNSMYQPYSDNNEYIVTAVNQFADIVFKNNNEGNNRIAMVQYDTQASAWDGSKLVYFQWGWNSVQGISTWDRTVSNYGLTYSGCFMTSTSAVKAALDKAMYAPDTTYTSGGLTNTMGGFFMTDLVARTRSTNTDRDLVIIMFTDGLPTCRYLTETRYVTYDNSGTKTSAWEFRRAVEEAQNLRASLNGYTKCNSTIYNIALLNDPEINSQDMKIIRSLMSTDSTYQWTYNTNYNSDNYVNLRNYVDQMSTFFTKTDSYADYYKEITGSIGSETLADLYKDIAYEFVAAKYVTGTITDVIPADFVLTEASKAALTAAGCTITYNADGTTTITKNVTANTNGDGFSYDIVYQGSGYGSVYTNDYAKFDYKDLTTDASNTAYFPQPTVAVIPWTVNDREFAQLSVPTTINVLKNDLFAELTEGGYTILDFTVTLTDQYGNPMTYNDAVEQTDYGFDAVLDPASNAVTYYTEQGGAGTFYYVVSANVVAPDGTVTTVDSRATRVDVLVSELDKYAEEVTNKDLPEGISVTTDQYGNVRQMYLVTLTVNLFDINNGKIVDQIPNDFAFVAFAETSNLNCKHDATSNTITVSNINLSTDGIVVSYYIRYLGTGYGVRPTNTSANITYTPNGSSTPKTDEFPVPTAGLNPFTVNDVDIAKAGEEHTLDISANDLYPEIGYSETGYTVTPVNIYLTDENGKPLTSAEIAALGINIKINPDGSITYTAPDGEGTTQFYYVVESTVNLPSGNNYADGNSTTLVSRPTLVTLYTVEDIYIIVDFGLDTMHLDFIDYSGVTIDKNVLLSSLLTTGNFNTTKYGELLLTNGTKEVAFRPTTTVFNQTAEYTCKLTLAASDYNKEGKTLNLSFNVIPANNIYFEEYFIDFDSAWTDSATANKNTLQNASEYHNQMLHGFDDAYSVKEKNSNGSQKEVTVCAHDREHTGYFTFAGTGFDIIGTTNANSGVIVAEVYKYDASKTNGCGDKVKNILVDTWLPNQSYEQIPIIQFRASEYGTYRVKLRAFYNEIFDHNYEQPMALCFDAATDTFATQTVRSIDNGAYRDLELIRVSGGYVIAAKVKENVNGVETDVYYAMSNAFDGSSAKFNPVTSAIEGGILRDYVVTMTQVGGYYTISNGSAYLSFDGISIVSDSDAYNWKQETGVNGNSRLVAADTLACVPTYKNSMAQIREVLGLGANEELEIYQLAESMDVAGAKRSLVDADNGHYNAYIDAIRIYNPIEKMTDSEKAAYAAAGELNPTFTNVNDSLLDSNSTTWGDSSVGADGLLYIGYNGQSSTGPNDNYNYSGVFLSNSGLLRTQLVGSKTYLIDANGSRIRYNNYSVYIKPKTEGTVTVSSNLVDYYYTDSTGKEIKLEKEQILTLGLTYYENRYESIGPENEVYLKHGNGIAFAVDVDVSVQVSVKTPYGESFVMLQVYDALNGVWRDVANINSRTEMYYSINSNYVANGVIILRCQVDDDPTTNYDERADSVMSICNVKVASGSAVATNDKALKPLTYEQIANVMYAFEPKEAHEHTWGEWTVTTEPTCTENGEESRYCDCGETETREIEATGHTFGEWAVTEEPTCTEKGEETRTCECGETETREIEATGHSFGDWTVTTEPTCTESGEETRTCACGETETRELSAVGHDFYDWYTVEPPTCTADGKTARYCKNCDYFEEGTITQYASCYLAAFTDVPVGSWFHDAIEEMVSRGYMNGISAEEFAPNGTLNRAMVVTVLYRMAGEPETGKSTFTDVPEGQWYSDAIAWAQAEGVVNGVSATEFAPMAEVTREQIATILYRYNGATAPESSELSKFPDADKISDYARDAMAWAVEEGIFSGDNFGKLNPTDNATRAEFATIMKRSIYA